MTARKEKITVLARRDASFKTYFITVLVMMPILCVAGIGLARTAPGIIAIIGLIIVAGILLSRFARYDKVVSLNENRELILENGVTVPISEVKKVRSHSYYHPAAHFRAGLMSTRGTLGIETVDAEYEFINVVEADAVEKAIRGLINGEENVEKDLFFSGC